MAWILTLIIGYLLGSIPFGYILVRTFKQRDIRQTGSGNIGATNVSREGKGLGLATLFLDALKGWAAVMVTHHIARHYGMGPIDAQNLAAVGAVAAILGHMFPVWLGFRGGKGVATALGVFLALSWPAALASLAVFIAVAFLWRYVSLASVIAAATLPLFAALLTPNRSAFFVMAALLISLLVIVKHHTNLQRLRDGLEDKFGEQEPGPSPSSEL
jgi:glycerol-3-phosphate acyltransferase PlsY